MTTEQLDILGNVVAVHHDFSDKKLDPYLENMADLFRCHRLDTYGLTLEEFLQDPQRHFSRLAARADFWSKERKEKK